MSEFQDIHLINLKPLHNTLQAKSSEIETYEKEATSNFNSLDVLNTKETHLTKAIAWFLNPTETHCQKELFLNGFLKELGIDKNEVGNFLYVDPEKYIGPYGQVDIHLECEHCTIIIENKIWQNDNPDQLDNYIEWLEKKNRRSYYLLFLSMQAGKNPVHSDKFDDLKNKFRVCSHEVQTRQWLKLCKKECLSPRVSAFIDEIIQWIDFKVGGGKEIMTEKKVLEDIITKDEDTFEMIWDITNVFNFEENLNKSIQDTKNQLKKDLKDKLPDYFIDDTMEGGLFTKSGNQGWINLYKKAYRAKNLIPQVCYTIEGFSLSNGVYVGISKDGSKIPFQNETEIETEILNKIISVCETQKGTMFQNTTDEWWTGAFYPKIVNDLKNSQSEYEMAWHLVNPGKRNEFIRNISDAMAEIIHKTEHLVEHVIAKSQVIA